jgi:peptide/nickel transport system substrate-binding protein/oligopeptide transport system substrate-binding protein
MLNEHLGVEVELLEVDQNSYMAALTAKPTEILFGYVSYGMDYLDPTNMLGVWLSGGRHSWVNEEFDAKVDEGAVFLGPTEERIKLFQDAERILVEDVPAVFIYHETPLQLVKPWVSGAPWRPTRAATPASTGPATPR